MLVTVKKNCDGEAEVIQLYLVIEQRIRILHKVMPKIIWYRTETAGSGTFFNEDGLEPL